MYFDKTKTELITDAQKTAKQGRIIVLYVDLYLKLNEYVKPSVIGFRLSGPMETLQIYLRGRKFILHTDCKPVEFILGRPETKPFDRNLRNKDFSNL